METAPKVGEAGRRVAENVKRLRGRVPVRELSARLEALGRPILPSGITKIEQGSRRVDVDDLAALAEALDVHPMRLLLPADDFRPASIIELERDGDLDEVRGAFFRAINAGISAEVLVNYVRKIEEMRPIFEEWAREKEQTRGVDSEEA